MTEVLVRIIFAAVLGGVLGSFANVAIIRWHEAAPLTGRSRCPHCKTAIRPKHLVPVLSWILLRGRCADCGKKIHVQYPLVEASCAALAVIAALRSDPFSLATTPDFLFELVLSIGLVVPVVMDWRWKELPVEYLSGLGIFLFAFRVADVSSASGWSWALISSAAADLLAALGAAAFFSVQFIVSRGRWVGIGDAWFGAFMGAALGWPKVAIGIYFAYIVGGFAALIGLISGKLKRGDKVPFAPALALGTLLAHWYGSNVVSWIAMRYG